jgi:DNA-directed RNA polymerase subunit RPC12/RpoP
MVYEEFPLCSFFTKIDSEQKAIDLIWQYKSAESVYRCSKCKRKKFYQLISRPEIRECKSCGHHNRVRVGTIFQNSKLPLLKWVRGLYLMMMGKRGISALELQKQLELKTYKSSLLMLRKIRFALLNRDKIYKLEGIIELDGAQLGRRETNNDKKVLIAVESKDWIDEHGKEKKKAGFAKVYFGNETKENVEDLIEKDIRMTSEVHTDSSKAFIFADAKKIKMKSKPMLGIAERLQAWLPWVQKFMFNAKSWIRGTHHGVDSSYFELYMAEYTYRFNRRHDAKRFFSRALFACASSDCYSFEI